ncbi:MAG TPA: response regulator [Clostridiaceae bacterium]|nr:response regulator [Clostridiaceae bacterium]
MFKVLIADDEPKIRKGLYEAIDWESLNMTVAGVARDGREALAIAEKEKPDICLIDICMPFVNGFELIDGLKKLNPDSVNIIVTGYDEFEYAQKAVKLGVFDYILKPVSEEELLRIVIKAKTTLEEAITREKRYEWANAQLKKSMPFLKEKFINDWLNGMLTVEEIDEQLDFHNISIGPDIGMIIVKTRGVVITGKANIEWERQLLVFAIQNIFEEMLEPFKSFITARDAGENLVALVSVNDRKAWGNFRQALQESVEKYLNHRVEVYQEYIREGKEGVSCTYEDILKTMRKNSCCLPVIKKIKAYVEKNYHDPELSLQRIADEMEISISHLSKLFKQETGMSFIDYLIKTRIMESIKLMSDPNMKIYEIAEKVGYSSQHYFCAAFKKVLGFSPTEYRNKELIK